MNFLSMVIVFSDFPMPKSLEGFANQSLNVGVGLMSKGYTNIWYSTKFKHNDTADCTRTVVLCMTPEKKLVYQIFHLLGTHEVNPERTNFTKTYISSIKDKILVELQCDVLERSMKESPTTSADNILTTLSLVYQESIDK